jgi:hypothetical protein
MAFTGGNAAMGGQRGTTLILTNRSGGTCYVYGYVGLGFLDGHGKPLPAHMTWLREPHGQVTLRPGANARALLTWRVNVGTATPFSPDQVVITPPDEFTHLAGSWPGGPVLGGDIAGWPLHAAAAGAVPTGTGTVRSAVSGMCMAAAGNGRANGTKVVAWKCAAGASSQQWTGYSDGTLRINGSCLAVSGGSTKIGAKVELWACTGASSQQWAVSQASFNPFGAISGAGSGNVLTDPGGSTANGTQLEMGANRGDQSPPWRVSFHHYLSP